MRVFFSLYKFLAEAWWTISCILVEVNTVEARRIHSTPYIEALACWSLWRLDTQNMPAIISFA